MSTGRASKELLHVLSITGHPGEHIHVFLFFLKLHQFMSLYYGCVVRKLRAYITQFYGLF